ncbi:hypothetical protein IFO70_10510 [Phormidium tenue FACHB-886]|nr:hypothetical protein [Phormidium tenue FACHB-886]
MTLSASDQTLLDSLKPELVISAFKYKGWRPLLENRLPLHLRNADALALIKDDRHVVVYWGEAWHTRKLEAITTFAEAEKIPVSSAISYLADFISPDCSEGNLTATPHRDQPCPPHSHLATTIGRG